MTAFRSRWDEWAPKEPTSRTDKTDKSPSVSFVSSTEEGLGQENEHVRCVVLLGQPDPGEHDNHDAEEGRRIVEAVQATGGWLTIEDEQIVLRWHGDMPGTGGLIDRIRTNRSGVVAAVRRATD